MNKTEKEYYSKCWKRTGFKSDYAKNNQYVYPTCVYYDTEKCRCELNFCYRDVKEKKHG